MTITKMIMLSQVGLVLDSLDDIHCLTEATQKEEVGRIERTNYKDDGDDDDDDEPSLMMVVSGGDHAMHVGKISRKQSKRRRRGVIIFSWIMLW